MSASHQPQTTPGRRSAHLHQLLLPCQLPTGRPDGRQRERERRRRTGGLVGGRRKPITPELCEQTEIDAKEDAGRVPGGKIFAAGEEAAGWLCSLGTRISFKICVRLNQLLCSCRLPCDFPSDDFFAEIEADDWFSCRSPPQSWRNKQTPKKSENHSSPVVQRQP